MADSEVANLTDKGGAPSRNHIVYLVNEDGTVEWKLKIEDLFSFFDVITYQGDVVTYEGDIVYYA